MANYRKKQEIEARQKLAKLEAQQDWEKEYREGYTMTNSKKDMQSLYSLYESEEARETVRGKLNAINDRMLERGLIDQKTYNTRYRNINGIEGGRGGRSGGGRKGSGKDTFSAPNLPNFKVGNAPKVSRNSATKTKGIVKGLKVDSSKANISVKELPRTQVVKLR